MDYSRNPLPHLAASSQPIFETLAAFTAKRNADREVINSTVSDTQKSTSLESQSIAEVGSNSENTSLPERPSQKKECHIEPTKIIAKIEQVLEHPTPTGLRRTMIEGYPFWLSKESGSGLQLFVLKRADHLGHRVCVVLESFGRRLYSSFINVQHFWWYYSNFKGRRCFYWINRSFEVSNENSLLHFDVEWYTPLRDLQAN